jgi:hypothetical protein
MQRPDVIRIAGVRWAVRYLSRAQFFVDTDLLGQCRSTQTTIEVREDLPADRLRFILWHELVHAIEGDAGLTLSEEAVRALAAGLFALLRGNPELAAWLLEEQSNGSSTV